MHKHRWAVFAAAFLVAGVAVAAALAGSSRSTAGKTFYFIPKDTLNPYEVIADRGGKIALTELGDTQVVQSGTEDTAAAQQPAVQAAIQARAAGIVIAGNDPDALCPALKQAQAAGTHVIAFDSDVSCRELFINQADTETIGRSQIALLAKMMGYKGEFAILSAASTATNQNAWIKYMKLELKKPRYKNMKLVKIYYGNDNPAQSRQATVSMLQAYPNLKGIESPTTVGISSAAQYLSTSKKYKNKIVLTGLGLPSQMKKYVHDGTVRRSLSGIPRISGTSRAMRSRHSRTGKITGKVGETFKAGKLGTYKILLGPDKRPQVILGPPYVFTSRTSTSSSSRPIGAPRALPRRPHPLHGDRDDTASRARHLPGARPRRASVRSTHSRTATSTCSAARSTVSLARTAPASRRSSRSLRACIDPTPGGSCWTARRRSSTTPSNRRTPGSRSSSRSRSLFPDLSVAENIFVGVQPLKRFRRIDGRRMRREAATLFEQLGVKLDPDRLARGLSIADQQLVEIAKALTTNARVIVMDEPTAALATTEVERLFRIVETLRARGNAVLFVSHRLEEIFEICQRVTVMRDGRHVWTKPIDELTVQSVIRAMVGRDMDALFPKVPTEPGRVVLKVDRLTREGDFTDVSFVVRSGEIVALAGLVGAGRTEVARAIFGIDRWDAGSVEIDGRRLPPGSPSQSDGCRDRARPRGPAPAGPCHGLLDRAQHRARVARHRPARGLDPPGLRAQLRAATGRSACS